MLDLTYHEDNGNVIKLELFKVVVIVSLRNYILHLNEKGKFSSYPRDFRHTYIDANDFNDFKMHPNSHVLFDKCDKQDFNAFRMIESCETSVTPEDHVKSLKSTSYSNSSSYL